MLRTVEASLGKAAGAEVMYEDEPGRLIDRLLERYHYEDYVRPWRPGPSHDQEKWSA